ncbi:MAG TPA: tetratricopeptide repeat protein [Candidatus Tumulicola sp.]|nr:tetratricopeptide repeat protein [Candidatus Tumulicola sp.]
MARGARAGVKLLAALGALSVVVFGGRIAAADPTWTSPGFTALSASEAATDLAGAKLLIRQGRALLAVPALRADHQRDPANDQITIALAQALAFSGEHGQAIALLGDVILAHPADVSARAALGQAYALNGDFNAAEAQFRVALDADPRDVDAQNGLAHAYALEGRAVDARRLYDAVLAQHADNADALVGRGAVEALDGKLHVARADYRSALALEPENVQAGVELARIELGLGDYAASVALVDRALSTMPDDADATALRLELRRRLAPTLDLAGAQTIGNGIAQSRSAFAPRWFVNPRLQLGVEASRFTLSHGSAQTSADRFGVTAAYGRSAAGNVRVAVDRSQFTGWGSTIDASAILAGVQGGTDYRVGFQSGGIDAAAGAQENLIAPYGAGLRVNNLFADIGTTSRNYGFHAHAIFGGYSDTNRYRELDFDVDRRFALGDTALVTLSAAERAAGFRENYSAVSSHGYYDYTAQSDVTLSALASARLGARTSAGVLALLGQRHTIVLAGSSGAQPFSRFEPYVAINAGGLTFGASDSISRYGSAPRVPNYYSNALRVDVRLRM